VEQGESPLLRTGSFRFHSVSKNIIVKAAKSRTNIFNFSDPRVAAEEQLER
jgi:hypothetical protein